jgi:copper chaperone CopZ
MSGLIWGLKSSKQGCLIFLHPYFVLSTPSLYVLGLAVSAACGVLAEFLSSRRRRMKFVGVRGVGAEALIYGIQTTLAYILMYVIMTYSYEMLFSVVFGLVLGHVAFNRQSRVSPGDCCGAIGRDGNSSGGGRVVSIHVAGMTCEACVLAVEQTILRHRGVFEVEVSLVEGVVRLRVAAACDVAAVAASLDEAGFEARL